MGELLIKTLLTDTNPYTIARNVLTKIHLNDILRFASPTSSWPIFQQHLLQNSVSLFTRRLLLSSPS
jgi:hypothetical protein